MADSHLMAQMLDEHWRLPFDVVPGIMAASEPPTISALMKTCHALYTEGPKHLLRHGVELNSAYRTILFAKFMLTKDPSRPGFAHFCKLALPMRFPVNSPGAQMRLIHLLSHPSLALETLVLDYTSGLLSSDALASLRGGFGRMKTLKHLVALRVREGSASLIQSLPSKLVSISIGVDARPGSYFDVLSTLKPFSDTLQTVLIKSAPSDPPLMALTDAGSFYFPCVRTFGIVVHDSVPELLASPAFARAFPAVTHLKLIPTDPPTPPYRSHPHGRWQLHHLVRLREGNRVQILQHRNTGAVPASPLLTECSGGLHDVYALGLDCPLSTLRVWQHVPGRDLGLLCTVLEDTRPQRLCFSTEVYDVYQVLALLGAFKTQTPPRIDMNISIPWSSSLSRLLKGHGDMLNRSFLESSLRELPTGLVELNLLVDVPDTASLSERSAMRDVLEAFTCWASKAAPDLALACRLAVDEDWEWPDLGQSDDHEYDVRLRRW